MSTQELAPMAEMALMHQEPLELTVTEIVAKVGKVREVAQEAMKPGIHYGTIPGTAKPTLYKPGGEILGLTFRLAPKYDGDRTPIDLGNGHREHVIRCDLYHIHTGLFYGSGVGSCSTLEAKYRYRTGPKELTDQAVPREYWNYRNSDPAKAKDLIGGPGYSIGKNDDGKWMICIQGEKAEHDNPADYYNTVLKMAAKRAYIDAILKATAASEVYTQDLEDIHENDVANGYAGESAPPDPIKQPQKKSESHDDAISEAQVKRLWAIGFKDNSNRKGLSKDQIAAILRAYGYTHADQIKKSDYERIVATIEKGQVPAMDQPPHPADGLF
jgi:hypothetical protein